MPLPLAAFLAASTWAAKTVLLSGETLQLLLTAVQVLRAPSLWEGVQEILAESEYADLTDFLDFVIDELLTETEAGMPIGTIVMWTGRILADPPDKWLMCDGSQVSRETYADLYALLGDGWGDGDGSTTFNLPDFRAKFPMGSNPAFGGIADFEPHELADYGGEEYHQLTISELPEHQHEIYELAKYRIFSSGSGGGAGWQSTGTTNSYKTGVIGEDEPHYNIPPFNAVNFIIKALL